MKKQFLKASSGAVKKCALLIVMTLLLLCLGACGSSSKDASQTDDSANQASSGDSRVLVAYFSATGNTESIAEQIAEETNADLFEIIPEDRYSSEDLDYSNDECRANKEQNDKNSRPEIKNSVEDMSQYDIVFIGHPIWWGEEPRIMDTVMESYDFSQKTLVNFCTSGGSGIDTSTENLKALSSDDAAWLTGHRFESGAGSDEINEWLKELNLNFEE